MTQENPFKFPVLIATIMQQRCPFLIETIVRFCSFEGRFHFAFFNIRLCNAITYGPNCPKLVVGFFSINTDSFRAVAIKRCSILVIILPLTIHPVW